MRQTNPFRLQVYLKDQLKTTNAAARAKLENVCNGAAKMIDFRPFNKISLLLKDCLLYA